jgi:GNAT superfamily N-acetyltransferase
MAKFKAIDILPDYVEEKMSQELIEHEASNGVDVNYKKFYLVLYNTQEAIIGVINAYTAFSEIYIDDMWVDSNYRGKGYGRVLLKELENMFEDKGFNNINLCTSQFQAPEFYKKCGFQLEFIRQNNINHKLSKFFFSKMFKNKQQVQGLLSETTINR